MNTPDRGSWARYLFYGVWAVLMTALTYFLGAVSLKLLRRKGGRVVYWSAVTGLSVLLFAAKLQLLSLTFFSLVVLVGVFSEFEEMGLSLLVGAFFTLVINSLLAGGAFAVWMYVTGPQWSRILLGHFETVLKPVADLNPQSPINYFQLMQVAPSAILCMWICALYLAILLESRLSVAEELVTAGEPRKAEAVTVVTTGSGADFGFVPMNRQLLDMRMPDAVVWIFIAALLGTYGGFAGPAAEATAANALNVCLVLFFFQGIGIVSRFFSERLRLGGFWQLLTMLLLVYLFPLVAVLGLVDHWFDFRTRMTKRAGEFNRET